MLCNSMRLLNAVLFKGVIRKAESTIIDHYSTVRREGLQSKDGTGRWQLPVLALVLWSVRRRCLLSKELICSPQKGDCAMSMFTSNEMFGVARPLFRTFDPTACTLTLIIPFRPFKE
jgi:hypothetical protein